MLTFLRRVPHGSTLGLQSFLNAPQFTHATPKSREIFLVKSTRARARLIAQYRLRLLRKRIDPETDVGQLRGAQ